MQILHHGTFRPGFLLAAVILLIAILACGTDAAPVPAVPPAAATSGSTAPHDANAHGAQGQSGTESQAQDSGGEVVINLPIADRDTTLTRNDLRVSQGDTVKLMIESDEDGEVHLHGYDLTADVSPGHPGELVFEASTAGAFALNFHVFADADAVPADDHHGADTPLLVASESPVSVAITAEPDADGGVDVVIATEGFRFAPEMVDQAHTPGAGHAHIYADGVKLGRVFENEYHIAALAPGEHEIRVSLNTNDHSNLTFEGNKVESTVTVTVPDVGQGHGDNQGQQSGDGHGHSHGTPGERKVIAEVHLGNLEVYP